MSTPTGVASDEASMKLPTSCPYIGMASDPQTHVGIPDNRNYCHLVNPPGAVYISHQQGSCLSNSFPNCPIYQTSGEGPFPDGILEDSKSPERGFALGLFGIRRAQTKASKQTSSDVISEPEEDMQSESNSESIDETELDSGSLVVTDSISKPVSSDDSEQNIRPQLPPKTEAAFATLAATNAMVDGKDLRMRSNTVPKSRYERARKPKKERRGFWFFLMVAALLVLLFSVWGIYNWMQKQQYDAQAQAELGYTISLATAVQDMGAAAEAWGTAASLLQAQQETSTAAVISTATADHLALLAQQTSQVSTAIALTATPTSQVTVCRNITDAALEIIAGPILTPSPGTIYRTGISQPQASWVVQNIGNCSWSQILLWSMLDNTIVEPIIKLNGQEVTPDAASSQPLVLPGEQVEIVLTFKAIGGAQRVKGDWVLVADGLSLVSQPHMEMNTNNWIVLPIVNTPTPTRPGKPGGGSGSQPPSGVTPPQNTPAPTEVPVPTRPG